MPYNENFKIGQIVKISESGKIPTDVFYIITSQVPCECCWTLRGVDGIDPYKDHKFDNAFGDWLTVISPLELLAMEAE